MVFRRLSPRGWVINGSVGTFETGDTQYSHDGNVGATAVNATYELSLKTFDAISELADSFGSCVNVQCLTEEGMAIGDFFLAIYDDIAGDAISPDDADDEGWVVEVEHDGEKDTITSSFPVSATFFDSHRAVENVVLVPFEPHASSTKKKKFFLSKSRFGSRKSKAATSSKRGFRRFSGLRKQKYQNHVKDSDAINSSKLAIYQEEKGRVEEKVDENSREQRDETEDEEALLAATAVDATYKLGEKSTLACLDYMEKKDVVGSGGTLSVDDIEKMQAAEVGFNGKGDTIISLKPSGPSFFNASPRTVESVQVVPSIDPPASSTEKNPSTSDVSEATSLRNENTSERAVDSCESVTVPAEPQDYPSPEGERTFSESCLGVSSSKKDVTDEIQASEVDGDVVNHGDEMEPVEVESLLHGLSSAGCAIDELQRVEVDYKGIVSTEETNVDDPTSSTEKIPSTSDVSEATSLRNKDTSESAVESFESVTVPAEPQVYPSPEGERTFSESCLGVSSSEKDVTDEIQASEVDGDVVNHGDEMEPVEVESLLHGLSSAGCAIDELQRVEVDHKGIVSTEETNLDDVDYSGSRHEVHRVGDDAHEQDTTRVASDGKEVGNDGEQAFEIDFDGARSLVMSSHTTEPVVHAILLSV